MAMGLVVTVDFSGIETASSATVSISHVLLVNTTTLRIWACRIWSRNAHFTRLPPLSVVLVDLYTHLQSFTRSSQKRLRSTSLTKYAVATCLRRTVCSRCREHTNNSYYNDNNTVCNGDRVQKIRRFLERTQDKNFNTANYYCAPPGDGCEVHTL